jgi:subtilase family serine protease
MSATNYFTRVDNSEGASGGTSAVAPLMAALVARLNQAKKKNVGFLSPFLYANVGKASCMTSPRAQMQSPVRLRGIPLDPAGTPALAWGRPMEQPYSTLSGNV